MEFDATTWATIWVFISLIIFLAVAVYFGMPKMVTKMLDERINRIEAELDEARKLREDAHALLAEYERKRIQAESEADEIIAAAQDEAERMTAEAETALQDLIARRTKAVEEKIAQAEAQAVGEVRARSAEVAVEAAKVLLTDKMGDKGDTLIDAAIKEVGERLN